MQRASLPPAPLFPQGLPYGVEDVLVVERFADVVVGTRPHRTRCIIGSAVGRNHDDWQTSPPQFYLRQHLKTVHIRQLHIEQHQVRRLLINARQRLFSGGGRQRHKPCLLHKIGEHPTGVVQIVHDENLERFEFR